MVVREEKMGAAPRNNHEFFSILLAPVCNVCLTIKSLTHTLNGKNVKKNKISWSNGHTEKKVVDFLLKQIHFFTHVILFGDFCFSLPPSHRIRYSGKKSDDFNGQSLLQTVGKIFHRLKKF